MTDPAILITGAARRIGRAIALRLAEDGYDIALHYNGSQEDAETTAKDIESCGQKAVLLQADLMDTQVAATLIRRAKDALPGLCGLVHNASVFEEATFADTTEVDFDRDLTLHLKTPYFLSQAYSKQIGRGSVICLLDTYVTRQTKHFFPYLLSKKALAELAHMLAYELAPNIRVNAIAPGLILPSGERWGEDAFPKRREEAPLKKLGTPEDIADAAAYLLRADYLTGHTLFIDGGDQLR